MTTLFIKIVNVPSHFSGKEFLPQIWTMYKTWTEKSHSQLRPVYRWCQRNYQCQLKWLQGQRRANRRRLLYSNSRRMLCRGPKQLQSPQQHIFTKTTISSMRPSYRRAFFRTVKPSPRKACPAVRLTWTLGPWRRQRVPLNLIRRKSWMT